MIGVTKFVAPGALSHEAKHVDVVYDVGIAALGPHFSKLEALDTPP